MLSQKRLSDGLRVAFLAGLAIAAWVVAQSAHAATEPSGPASKASGPTESGVASTGSSGIDQYLSGVARDRGNGMLAANDSDAAQDSTAPQTLTPDLPPMAKAPPQVEETPGPGKTLLLIVGGLLALALTAAGLMFALNGFLADLRRRRRAHRRHFHREDDLTATTPR